MTREEIVKILCELAGEASLCWQEPPLGIFDSGRAISASNKAADRILAAIDKEKPKASAGLVEALEKLSCLGNGNIPGNSDGNRIAQEALTEYRRHESAKPTAPSGLVEELREFLKEENCRYGNISEVEHCEITAANDVRRGAMDIVCRYEAEEPLAAFKRIALELDRKMPCEKCFRLPNIERGEDCACIWASIIDASMFENNFMEKK